MKLPVPKSCQENLETPENLDKKMHSIFAPVKNLPQKRWDD